MIALVSLNQISESVFISFLAHLGSNYGQEGHIFHDGLLLNVQ